MSDGDRYGYPPRFFSKSEAARYLGVCVTTFLGFEIVPVNIGRRVLYDRQSLDIFADRLVGKPLDGNQRDRASCDVEAAFMKRFQRG